ncbi:hypothetical protein JTB14_001492 [Gonioctena quinquepunctata]|nr:hypothetical protein JTB14_001492 [Gonioctena quinquepunctata]
MESAYRATCRRQVTKLMNTATNLLNDNDTDTDEFVVMLARLKSAKETLTMANREVLVNEQDAETEYETRLEYDDKAVTTMAKLERRMEKSKTIASIPQRIAQDHSNNEIVRQKSTVRLPKLELKHINGDISAWPSFWEQFRTVVHENKELDAIAKFNYLQSVLVGKAATTISGLTPTAACYNDSIEMLKSEYGNNDRIIDSYVHKMNSLNAVENKNEIWALRNLYNSVSSIMRTFNALSVPIKEYWMIIYNNEFHSAVVNSRPEINIGENESTPERAIDSNGNEILINKLMFFLKTEIERAKDINVPILASDSKIVDTSKFEKDTLLTPTTADFCNRNVSKSFNLADTRIEGIEPIEGISMLVGADNYWTLVTGETEKISERLTAVNTKFGWTLHGPASIDSFDVNQNIVTLLHATMLENEDESNESIDIKTFWDLETLGIRDNEEISNEFTQHFTKNNIVMRRNRYEVSLPWKNPNINSDHNFPGALARVKSLTSKFIRNSALFKYDSAVREYIKSDCAEMIGDVSVSSMDFPKNITHLYFMPHRPVYREDKTTTKLRVVFDASAHAPGFASLNELLNPVIPIQPEKYKVTCETLDNSFYVDDLVVALKTRNEAEQIYKESTQIMLGAAMKLGKWCSNDEILRNMLEKDNVAEISNIRKVLDIQWHINSDELSIDINAVLDLVKSPGTKRNVLKMVSNIYDPMGFIGPFTLRMKILLQSIWKLELGWDELLPGDILEMWIAWSRGIFVLQDFVVPRCVVAFPHDNLQLHNFADGSPRAYGALAYIRCSFVSQITVNLLMTKNRVAPIKQSSNDSLTLPKLELTASLCVSRLSKYIEEKLSIVTNQIFIWSDSKIALY